MNDTPQEDPTKLFVGNLPWSMTEEGISEIFSKYGEIVDVHLVTDQQSGRSRGIAFVRYGTAEEAANAIKGENETEIEGRALRVNVARPRQPRENRGGSGGYRGGSSSGSRGGYGGGNRGGYGNRGGQY
ncbi:RNA-binding protein [Patescibacteria group bacterium]|nr:RNA-binding protein [Patescibacteria group bacterium]MBU1966802.1 RNA-binding protein [Patescibacteria group bacterium]MBU2543607.1 RNA-binding protein [Patescibacteria group bacterium]